MLFEVNELTFGVAREVQDEADPPPRVALQGGGAEFSLVRTGKPPLPQVLCVMKDGTRITGSFTLSNGRINKVTAEITNKPTAAAASAEPAKPAKGK